jgi:hypothetical protein
VFEAVEEEAREGTAEATGADTQGKERLSYLSQKKYKAAENSPKCATPN